jgi:hypothetical protein
LAAVNSISWSLAALHKQQQLLLQQQQTGCKSMWSLL